MSQVTCASCSLLLPLLYFLSTTTTTTLDHQGVLQRTLRHSVLVVTVLPQIIERDPVGGGALVAKDFWSSQRSIR
jgi:hypothetical protein